jgi:hypothetical protein
VDDAMAARSAASWYELCLFLGGSPDSFTGLLLTLIAKADPGNRARRRDAYPRHVAAWETWQRIAPCTWGDLEAAIPEQATQVTVTFDITDPGARHALLQALDDYQVKETGLAADGDNPEKRTEWAAVARRLWEQAEAAGR